MLSAAQIEAMREQAEAAMPDTLTPITRTPTTTASGGTTYVEVNGASVACQLVALTGSERVIADQLGVNADAKIVYPASLNLSEVKHVSIGGVTYEVTYDWPTTAWSLTGVALVREDRAAT